MISCLECGALHLAAFPCPECGTVGAVAIGGSTGGQLIIAVAAIFAIVTLGISLVRQTEQR